MKGYYKSIITICVLVMFLLPLNSASAFEFGGFADIVASDSTAEGRRGYFTLGRLDLYALKKMNKITAFTEFLLEFNSSGSTAVDLERLWVKYSFGRFLNIGGGRFHTVMGSWNREYHHGAHMYHSIDRPKILDFEDDAGILPTHQIGLLLEGKVKGNPGKLEYYFMFGNGSKINNSEYILDANNISDNNDNKSYSVRTVLSPAGVFSGFSLGLGGIFSTVSSDDGVADQVAQNIWEFDIKYINGPVELIGEYYNLNDKKGRSFFNNMFFIQAAYAITEDIIPYYRFENQDINSDDPYIMALNSNPNNLNPIHDYHKNVAGVRYYITLESSVKAEIRFVSPRHSLPSTEYAVQWTYTF